jgi:hypothetical protein
LILLCCPSLLLLNYLAAYSFLSITARLSDS